MLKDALYKIVSLDHREGAIEAVLEINKDNEIFTGHFPGHPVLPGACMLQMVKELLETALNTKIRLKKADQMKFLRMIDPTINNVVSLVISYEFIDKGNINITAKLTDKEAVCFKFQGVFTRK